MIDMTTKQPLTVLDGGTAGPFLMVPVEQLDDVVAVLDAHDVPYWVDDEAISLDGGPEITVINFYEGTDAAAIQTILDNVS